MKYFLCKFRPPRKDFLNTMTAEESKLMKEHGAFLQDLLLKRKVVAHGPVLEPNGGWGLSLFEIEDSEDINAFTAQDPMIKANSGAQYEAFPMLQLRARA